MAAGEIEELPEALEVIYEAVKERLNLEVSRIDSLDTKAGVLIGFNGVILAVILSPGVSLEIIFFHLGLGCLLVSIILSTIAYYAGFLRRDPDPRQLRRWYSQQPRPVIVSTLIDNMVISFEDIQKKVRQKVRCFNVALILTVVGLGLLGVGSVVGRL